VYILIKEKVIKVIYGHKVTINVNYKKKKVELIVLNYKNEDINIGISL